MPASSRLAGRTDANSPAVLGRGGLAIAGLLLFLIGFLAELIVRQGERLGELERAVAGGGGAGDQEAGVRSQALRQARERGMKIGVLTHNYPRFGAIFRGGSWRR